MSKEKPSGNCIDTANSGNALDCMAYIKSLKESCQFKDDRQVADFAIMAQHEMTADSSEGAEYKSAVERLKRAGVDIDKMKRCFLVCPIIREQVFASMAFGSQI